MRKKSSAPRGAPVVPETLLLVPDQWWHPVLVLDVDGCLLEWREDFCKFVNTIWAAEGRKRRLHPSKMSIFLFGHDPRSGMTAREFGVMFKRFAEQSVGGFGDLKVIGGVVEAVKKIHAAGIDTIVMTDVPGALDFAPDGQLFGSGYAQVQRRSQLLRLGIVKSPDDVKFVRGHEKAARMVSEARRAPAAVEDRGSTAVMMAADYGLRCFLMAQNYNVGVTCPGVTRYADLKAAVPDILTLYDELEAAGKLKSRKKAP